MTSDILQQRLVLASPSRVRPWPYPYIAGLSIANDADLTSFEFFDELMRFLNSETSTRFGTGLGLAVTSSTFFFARPHRAMSIWAGLDPDSPATPFSERLLEYLRSGWIDANHGYGDFDGVGGFTRQHALRATDLLNSHGLQLGVYSNHGDHLNTQNIGSDAPYHAGDVPGSPAYHADLLRDSGVRYVWTDSLVLEGRRDIPGASLRGRAIEVARHHLRPRCRRENVVLSPCRLQDGQEFQGLWRIRGTGTRSPSLSSLHAQIARVRLSDLYINNGAAVLYQHLGALLGPRGTNEQATIGYVQDHASTLLSPLRNLSEESRSGRLWIEGLGRFLRYVEMVQMVDPVWLTNQVVQLPDPPDGLRDAQQWYAGLTLFVPPGFFESSSIEIEIRAGGRNLTYDFNGPDDCGRYSVTVRSRAREQIWE